MSLKLTPPTGDDAFAHVHEEVRHLVMAERAVRVETIYQDRWLDYPAGVDAIERLFELVHMPRRKRMPSILFWAAPNSGKTSIHREFQSRLATTQPSPLDETWIVELEINADLDERRLYLDLLALLQAPGPERASGSRLQRMVLQQLRARGVRVIVIDEFQRLVKLQLRGQQLILDALRYISNQLQISLAAFGSNEAKGLIEGDLHLKERFEIVALPSWSRKERWPVELVRQRIAYMPLRRETEVGRDLFETLERHSGRNLGRLLALLERAAVAALDKEESVTAELVEAVALRRRRAEGG